MAQQKSNHRTVVSPNGYVSIADAAKLLDISRHTVYRRIKRGEINAVELGGFKLIRRVEVERLIRIKARVAS